MENKDIVDVQPVDGSMVVSRKEAAKILKEHGNKVSNGSVEAFVTLKDINKIYPNGIQAVYDFNIDIKEHDFIVLVGPSGCGKSTTLRMIAGLEDITSGYLYINKVLSNYLPSKDRDISMVFQSYALYPQMTVYDNIAFPLRARKYTKPLKSKVMQAWDQVEKVLENPQTFVDALIEAKDRSINYTTSPDYISTRLSIIDQASKILLSYGFTDIAQLDMTVQGSNLTLKEKIIEDGKLARAKELERLHSLGYEMDPETYCLSKDGTPVYVEEKLTKEEIRNKVFEAARILDLGPYLDRRPKELSGGQMQRVALGRAIVRNAKLFLMDEPLSNLDAKLRVAMRSEIVRIHEQIGATTIYVTHDQTEAMTMATKIAVMSKGWVQQIGAPQEIYSHPKNIFVATFIGSPAMNILKGTYDNGKLILPDGYVITLDKEFKAKHDAFYQAKLADIDRMLDLPEFKKMHALKIIDEVLFTNRYFEMERYEKLIKEIIDMSHRFGADVYTEINHLLYPYISDRKDELKAQIEYAKHANNLAKMKEAMEVIETIQDEHGAKALEILRAQMALAETAMKNAYPQEMNLSTLNDYQSAIEKAMMYIRSHVEKGTEAILKKLSTIEGKKILSRDAKKWIRLIRKDLLTFAKLSSSDIGKLHNAQAFSDKEARQEETLYYRKGKKNSDKKKKIKVNLNSVDIAFVNNLYDVAMSLKENFEAALAGAHEVKLGIRPEHVHLDEEYHNPKKTPAFSVTSGVVELMGSELLVHTPWNGADLIAKIATGTLVKPHTEINLTLNGDKVLVFDIGSGDTIQ